MGADVGFAGGPKKEEGGALCRSPLVQGKRRFLATKPRSGAFRAPFACFVCADEAAGSLTKEGAASRVAEVPASRKPRPAAHVFGLW
ncbi:hypothetical protein B5F40_10950 [Gordonibacter sp. An230]|nr:hypothetical protein B5F40_10950 [Gordonibacter sp. An230]